MIGQTQQSEEVYRVEQMRNALGGAPVGTLEPGDEPDVCVLTSERRIGIEVTELHQDATLGHAPRRLQESDARTSPLVPELWRKPQGCRL